MIARIFATAVAALLGLYAFYSDILGAGHFLNPFGIMFMLLAGLIWFAWEPICDGFRAAKDESEIPISRLGATIIKGMKNDRRGKRPGSPSPPPPN